MSTATINHNDMGIENLLFDTDSYKVSMFRQYPPGTKYMCSYIESRGGHYDKTVFFGLQYYLKKYLSQRITMEMVEEAKEFYEEHMGVFPYEGWKRIVEVHGGRLPIKIRAVKEGTVVPTKNVLMTIESTDEDVFWVVTWVETHLLRIWFPITVGSKSYHIRGLINHYLNMTAEDPASEIAFKLHDFGSRGVSSQESAGIGGMAHLISFLGTDNIVALRYAKKFYGIGMAGYSIPASEHSTITSWGRDQEVEAYRNMLRQFAKPGSVVAVVSDSYDIFHAVKSLWGEQLRQNIIDSGATLVVRPDSGHPATIVLKCLELLEEQFGTVVNNKGYKVLNYVRVIQGDGINEDSIEEILKTITDAGYSATNVAFGMGGALLQIVNRDDQKFAMKCSQIYRDGIAVMVSKDPVTDPGKRSKVGYLDLVKRDGFIETVPVPTGTRHPLSILDDVWENGELMREQTFDEIRSISREFYIPPRVAVA